jgi:hypothetical protein
MKEAALLALPQGRELDQIHLTETGLSVSVSSTHPQSCCPLCCEPSSHVHSHYHRTLKDAACVGRPLELFLTVRKCFWRNPLCSRNVFTERIPEVAQPWARRTSRRRRANHLHWSSHLWQGGRSIGPSLRERDLSQHDLAPHSGPP